MKHQRKLLSLSSDCRLCRSRDRGSCRRMSDAGVRSRGGDTEYRPTPSHRLRWRRRAFFGEPFVAQGLLRTRPLSEDVLSES